MHHPGSWTSVVSAVSLAWHVISLFLPLHHSCSLSWHNLHVNLFLWPGISATFLYLQSIGMFWSSVCLFHQLAWEPWEQKSCHLSLHPHHLVTSLNTWGMEGVWWMPDTQVNEWIKLISRALNQESGNLMYRSALFHSLSLTCYGGHFLNTTIICHWTTFPRHQTGIADIDYCVSADSSLCMRLLSHVQTETLLILVVLATFAQLAALKEINLDSSLILKLWIAQRLSAIKYIQSSY
jgi:hypothetical protein